MEGAPRVSMLQLLEKSNSANNCTIIDQRRLWSESERGGWLCRGNLKLGDCSDEEVSTTITTTSATVGSHLETNNNEKRGTSAGVTVTVLKSEKRKMYRSYDLEGKSAITIKKLHFAKNTCATTGTGGTNFVEFYPGCTKSGKTQNTKRRCTNNWKNKQIQN
jgi:hypothetical protein